MSISLQRIDQLHKPDDFDDSLSAAQVAGVESSSVDYADFQKGLLSQIKRILYGDSAGNWHDNPADFSGKNGTLTALVNRPDPDDKNILKYNLHLTDVTIPTDSNVVGLTSTGKPSGNIAIGASSKGAVSAQLAGAIGSHSLDEQAGSNALRPKNLVAVFDGSTGDPILSDSRRVWGLLQVGAAATDGNPFGDSGNDQGQISFVRPNATYADLEAVPATGTGSIGGTAIVYGWSKRDSLIGMPEDLYRGDIAEADPGVSPNLSLDGAYNGGSVADVDASDVDWRLADTKAWKITKSTNVLLRIVRNDTTGDKVEIGSEVEEFDVNAAASDFAQGIAVDSADQAVNIGKTAAGVIDSASLEARATTGDNLVSAPAGDVTFKTVNQTTAIPLDDTTTGPISALSGGPYASIAAAIKGALDGAGGAVALTFDTFVAAANYAQGANIPGATLDLTAFVLDANTPGNTNLFLFLNGRLLFGGNGTTKNDVYAGDTPASGDIKVDFAKGIKTGDVILSIGLK